jgi:two-component system LytT family response regulator
MTSALRVAIVDDEPPARRLLRELLARHDDVMLVGEYATGSEAIEGLLATPADLAFLDIRLPDLDGFDVLRELPAEQAPAVVFVTAFDDFAIRAFEVEAVDYLLKPFDEERFDRALARARRVRSEPERHGLERVLALLEQLQRPAQRFLTRLPVRNGERTVLVPVAEIAWVEAAGKHSRVHTRSGAAVVPDTLRKLHRLLEPSRFVRISRSAVVNLDHVAEIHSWFHGDHMVVLRSGERIPSTRGYRGSLELLLRRDPQFAGR